MGSVASRPGQTCTPREIEDGHQNRTLQICSDPCRPKRPAPPQEAAHGSPPNRGRWVTAVRWGAVLMLLLGLGTIVLLLLAFGWHAMQPAPPSAKIGPKAYVPVQEGMAREEVQSAIGLPPGDYRDSAHKPGGACTRSGRKRPRERSSVPGTRPAGFSGKATPTVSWRDSTRRVS